jgi:GntR family transcriptional regulator
MAVLPDRSDRDKLYIQLTDILLSKIHSGEWRTGHQIPTEEVLCRSFHVSKITVRRAINNLVIEGYLEKLQGKGTFVRQGPTRAGLSMKTTLVEGVFSPEDYPNVKVVEKKIVTRLDEDVIRRMGPVIDRDVFYLCRLKLAEGVPVLVNEIYIPLRVCPALEGWDPAGGPVFEFLNKTSALKIMKVNQTVEVGRPGEAAGLLNVRPTSACMLIHRLFLAAGEMTVAYSKTTARGDRFKLDSEYVRLG